MKRFLQTLLKDKRKLGVSLIALLLVGVMGVSLFSQNVTSVSALEKTAEVDPATFANWQTYKKDDTMNVGRIWTDKSVFNQSYTLPSAPGESGSITVDKTEGSDFMIGLSALSSASNLMTTSNTPLDIVLVLDVSGSMDDNMESYVYNEVYDIENDRTYYGKDPTTNTYSQITREGYGGNRYWSFLGKEVEPKTSANDNDPNHIQFYRRETNNENISKIDALKTAVNGFLDATAKQNDTISEANLKHRISVVKFSGTSRDSYGNETYRDYDRNTWNYTQRLNELSVYDSQNVGDLKNAVSGLSPNGGTSADYGIAMAQKEFDDNARTEAKKVMVFFTDGEPNHGSGFSNDVANDAITSSKDLKDNDILVYSIGVFGAADPNNTSTAESNKFNAYMHGVSSNYPDATAYNNLGTRVEDSNYYKAATNADELNKIFEGISEEINQGTGSPTKVTEGGAYESGYVTFKDQLGDYVEVDDFNAIVYAGVKFDVKTKTTNGNITNYVFEGEVDKTEIYEAGNMNQLEISVQRSEDNKGDIVTVKVPAALIPLRYFDVSNGDTENTFNTEVKEAYPIRIFYSASLKDEVEKNILEGTNDETLKQYISENTEDGKAYFYSNAFTKGAESGLTTALFEPSEQNQFYYFTENTPIYNSKDETTPVKITEYDSSATYVYKRVYYSTTSNSPQEFWARCTGIDASFVEADENGNAVIKAKTRKTFRFGVFEAVDNKDGSFSEQKTNNVTGTATYNINPVWDSGNVKVQLGNNGRISLELPGTLSISKTVSSQEGFTAPQDIEFDFTLDLQKTVDGVLAPLTEEYNAQKYDGNEKVGNLIKVKHGDAIKLKDGEKLEIYGLPKGTQYKVTEKAVENFKTTVGENETSESTGEIESGNVSNVAFTNTYTVSPLEIPTTNLFKVSKVLTGRDWNDQDSFVFRISGTSGNEPLPELTDGQSVIGEHALDVVLKSPDSKENDVVNVSFGTLKFEKPGEYKYIIVEKTPDNRLPGLSYSESSYELTINVVDNNGELEAESTVVRKHLDDGTEVDEAIDSSKVVFTNTFNNHSVSSGPVLRKIYNDNSGNKPLKDGDFTFGIKPVAINGEENVDLSKAPLFSLIKDKTPNEDGYYEVTNIADGNVSFGVAEFTLENNVNNSYTYEYKEIVKDRVNGITYDDSVYRVTFKVDQEGESENAKVAVSLEYSKLNKETGQYETITNPQENSVFVNTYTPTPAILDSTSNGLHGIKTLNGRDMLNSDEFSFTATPDTATRNAINNGTIVVDNTNVNGTITVTAKGQEGNNSVGFDFGKLTINKPGTYKFDINENNNGNSSITYDTHITTATIIVVDEDGVLSASVTYDNSNVSNETDQAYFVNTYSATGELPAEGENSLTVTKVLEGRSWLNTDKFTFTLKADDKNTENAINNKVVVIDGYDLEKGKDIVVDQYQKSKSFGKVVFNEKGTYQFVITEKVESIPGVDYDEQSKIVTINVVDNNDGTLSPTISKIVNGDGYTDLTFTNTYSATPVELLGTENLKVSKVLNGRDWLETDEFKFVIEALNGAPNPNKTEVLINSKNKNDIQSFGDITFNSVGTYEYLIKEVIPVDSAIAGVSYSQAVYKVTVNVTDGMQGKLLASSNMQRIKSNDGRDVVVNVADKTAIFTNTYTPGSIELDGNTNLKVKKTFTGRENNEWLDGDSFEFVLTADTSDEATKDAVDAGNIVLPNPTAITIDKTTADHTSNFGNITFKTEGTYKFIISETKGDIQGVTYDTAKHNISVEVVDNPETGLLVATVVDGTKTYEFNNEYKITGTSVLTGIQVQKNIDGRDWLDEDKFEFEISAISENAKDHLPSEKVITVTEKSNPTAFKDITYDSKGTYEYLIKETGNSEKGITISQAEYKLTVNVEDNGVGGLKEPSITMVQTKDDDGKELETPIDVSQTKTAAFTNKYNATEFEGIPTNFNLTKVFEGRDWSDKDVFDFTLTADEGTPMPEKTTVTVGKPASGNTATFNFGNITYDKTGKYVYKVSEVKGTNAGIAYSTNVATITVNVTDNLQGGLVASATVESGTFTNTYSSELDYDAQGGLHVVKNLTHQNLVKDQFTFTLTAKDTPSQVKANMDSTEKEFKNTAADMVNGVATSTMNPLTGMKFTQADNGKIYSYTLSETSKQEAGYTNDQTVYTIEISITDDGNGGLKAVTHVTGTNGVDGTYEYVQSKAKTETPKVVITFDNKYEASTTADTEVQLTGNKTLTGRPQVAGEFTFNVTNKAGQLVSSGTNAADGTITFAKIAYTKAQLINDVAAGNATVTGNEYTYVYTVTEATPVDTGTTIVDGTQTVTVVVTDEGNGTLSTKVLVPDTGLTFVNAYGESAEAYVNMKGTKTLSSASGLIAPDITGKYTFTITAPEGTPMPQKTETTNDSTGTVDFGNILYTMMNVFGDNGQAIVETPEEEVVPEATEEVTGEEITTEGETGVEPIENEIPVEEDVVVRESEIAPMAATRQKTFTYTISETGTVAGVTNDAEVKTVTVTVTDNGDGTISVVSNPSDTKFNFTNTYSVIPTDPSAPTDTAVTINKNLVGRDIIAEEFNFVMTDKDGNEVSIGTNDADGKVLLSPITFNHPGTYEYLISEKDEDKGGIGYDSTTYKAIATVVDNSDGTLSVEWSVTNADQENVDAIEFENTYTVNPTSLTLGATKVLDGRELGDEEFLFELKDKDGEVIETVANDETGKVQFKSLEFDKAGTYEYTISEFNNKAEGITYDESVYKIVAEVTDNLDGTLTVKTTTTKDGEVSAVVFKNKAEPESVPEKPEKPDSSNTATQTRVGLFTSLAVDAAALSAILVILKKRSRA